MPRPRALAEPGRPGLYHVCSRVVDRRVIFGARERRVFMRMIKGAAAFAGVDLVSWCLMGNHFHLLVRVPVVDANRLSDEEVLARMEHIYPEPRMRHFRGVWERMGSQEARRGYLARFRARMGDLSDFVKTLKQRFSQWFNRHNNRDGTLWEGRFHSVMLWHNEEQDSEGLGILARFVAGYIDLNPLRAGVEREAGACDWSGYGSALRGDVEGLAGIRLLWGPRTTRGLADSGVLDIHRRHLERAQVLTRRKNGNEAPHGDFERKADREKPRPSRAIGAPKAEAPENRREISSESQRESRFLSLMGRRCEALIKGHVLGPRWITAQMD